MGVSWPFVVLIVYPAIQLPLLWVVVRYFGLRNDDGPRDPFGYATHPRSDGESSGPDDICQRCGTQNDLAYEYCGRCLAQLR